MENIEVEASDQAVLEQLLGRAFTIWERQANAGNAMNETAIVVRAKTTLHALIIGFCKHASIRFSESFASDIRNPKTWQPYAHAAVQ